MKKSFPFLLFLIIILLFMYPISSRATLLDNGDGTITDTDTGLMWLKDTTQAVNINFENAQKWAKGLTTGNYTDWRLPASYNKNVTQPICKGSDCKESELGQLYYSSLGNTAGALKNIGPFILFPEITWFWSSTDSGITSGNTWWPTNLIWYFQFDAGEQTYNNGSASNTFNAWAVRNVNPQKNFFIIKATAAPEGMIRPMGSVAINKNGIRTFDIEAKNGYKIDDVFVDGVSVGSAMDYTFKNIQSDHTIDVTFSISNNASPDTPATVLPADSGQNISLITDLKGTSYSDQEGDPHISTQWQISKVPFNDGIFSVLSLVLDQTENNNKIKLPLTYGILKPETIYYWRIRYRDAIGWSLWSNWINNLDYGPGSTFTTQKDNTDKNGNSIPDSQEITGFIDVNGDGIDDNTQEDIIPLISTVSGNILAIQTSSGKVGIAKTISEDKVLNPVNKPANYDFPDGLVNFVIEELLPGEEIEVTFFLSGVFKSTERWYKHNEYSGWEDITSNIIGGVGTDTIIMNFKDGEYGDDDNVTNGRIVDQSGYAIETQPVNDIKDDEAGAEPVLLPGEGNDVVPCFIGGVNYK